MKHQSTTYFTALSAIAVAMAARGAFATVRFTAPQLPESPYYDTEVATNAAFCAVSVSDNRFWLSIELDAESGSS